MRLDKLAEQEGGSLSYVQVWEEQGETKRMGICCFGRDSRQTFEDVDGVIGTRPARLWYN